MRVHRGCADRFVRSRARCLRVKLGTEIHGLDHAPAPRLRRRRLGVVPAPANLRAGAAARAPPSQETLPDAASEAIPPAKMAEAWRDEASTELRETLKGCSLYVMGLGARKNAVGRALAGAQPALLPCPR